MLSVHSSVFGIDGHARVRLCLWGRTGNSPACVVCTPSRCQQGTPQPDNCLGSSIPTWTPKGFDRLAALPQTSGMTFQNLFRKRLRRAHQAAVAAAAAGEAAAAAGEGVAEVEADLLLVRVVAVLAVCGQQAVVLRGRQQQGGPGECPQRPHGCCGRWTPCPMAVLQRHGCSGCYSRMRTPTPSLTVPRQPVDVQCTESGWVMRNCRMNQRRVGVRGGGGREGKRGKTGDTERIMREETTRDRGSKHHVLFLNRHHTRLT